MSNYEVFYKSPHNYDLRAESDRCAEVNLEPSLTVQSQAEEADINVLMYRYGLSGRMPDNPRIPSYGDFSEVTDFRSALHAVREAQQAFGEIPAEVRAQFSNDPQLFMDFCSNPANLPRMKELGLCKPDVSVMVPPPVVTPSPPVAPPVATPAVAPSAK